MGGMEVKRKGSREGGREERGREEGGKREGSGREGERREAVPFRHLDSSTPDYLGSFLGERIIPGPVYN